MNYSYFSAFDILLKQLKTFSKKHTINLEHAMNPKELILKCYAEKEGDCWVAVCINFNLAAQGDSFEEVKAKLESMINEYVFDALVGEDKAYAAQLLSRTAPLSCWLKFQFIRLKIALSHTQQRIFNETMPLRPA